MRANLSIVSSPGEPWPTVKTISVDQLATRIAAIAASIKTGWNVSPNEFSRAAQLAARLLPPELVETLIDFTEFGNGALLLRGLEVGPIGPTPDSPHGAQTPHTLLARETAVVLSALGRLVGYRPECGGELVQTLVPTRADRYRQTSTSSGAPLEIHTEQSGNLTTKPDFIALGCLRGDPNAATLLLSGRTIQRHLSNDTVRLLREEAYLTRLDPSFIDGGATDETRGPVSVLSGSWSDPTVNYDEDLMRGMTEAHDAALTELKGVWDKHHEQVVLQPGDILIMDNSRAVHGRSVFHPQWDGSDRWLCRAQVLVNYAASRHAREHGSPVIENKGV